VAFFLMGVFSPPGGRALKSPKLPSLSDPRLLELLGALMGDGWIGLSGYPRVRKQVCFCGNYSSEQCYRIRIQKLILATLHVNGYYQARPKNNTYYIIINSEKIFHFFIDAFGFPIGRKTLFDIRKLPQSWALQHAVIRGIFDTDGCLFFDRDPRYRCPYPVLDITMKNPEVLDWISGVLSHHGYPVLRGKKCVRIKGKASAHKWFKEISPKNEIHKKKYIEWKMRYCQGS
jgi:hypothetical protein